MQGGEGTSGRDFTVLTPSGPLEETVHCEPTPEVDRVEKFPPSYQERQWSSTTGHRQKEDRIVK